MDKKKRSVFVHQFYCKNRRFLVILMTVLLLSGCRTAQTNTNTYRQISTQEAINLMTEETGYMILDVRTEAEYETGHIPGAICVPNETIGTEEISKLPDKNQLILVYCRSGNRSKQAAQKLADQGYANIVEFGGINSWTGETVVGNDETDANY